MASIPTNPPANPVPGAVYVDIVTNTPYVWAGNAWLKATGSTGYNSQITTGAAILPGRFAIPPQDLVNQVGSNEPINPAAGQIWVDQSQVPAPIKIWDGTQWVLIGDGTFTNTTVQTSPPASPDLGDTFYETTTKLFYIWDGTQWKALNSNDYPTFAAPPPVGPAGDSYFNATSNTLFVSNGTSWLEVCMAPCSGGTDTHSFTGAGAPTLTQRPDTTALVAGDQYINTSTNSSYYWNGTIWASIIAQSDPRYPNVLSDGSSTAFVVPVGVRSGSAILVSTAVGGTITLPSIDAEGLPVGHYLDLMTTYPQSVALSCLVSPAAGETFQNQDALAAYITSAEIGTGIKGYTRHRFLVTLNGGGVNSRWTWTY